MKRERRDAAAGLMPYVQQGWIIPSEVQMVCHPASRRTALNWAARGGPASKKAMKQFIYALATLGLDQVVMNVRGPNPSAWRPHARPRRKQPSSAPSSCDSRAHVSSESSVLMAHSTPPHRADTGKRAMMLPTERT